jgi:hypothetical protein
MKVWLGYNVVDIFGKNKTYNSTRSLSLFLLSVIKFRQLKILEARDIQEINVTVTGW